VDIPKIQWYPGHIAKAEKKLSEVINKVDLVIEVRDARIPLSTGHPHLNKWINNKKHILVINRSDMISPNTINSWNKWFNTYSDIDINYDDLQLMLVEQQFEEADRLTSSYLRKLAGKLAEKRGYVFYSEVKNMSGKDLDTIDRLWTIYSTGRFGFSIQAKILKSVGKKYELMWPKIGWKKDGLWTRYPGSFCWSLDAPDGHMPLINQLRGVRLMDSILRHPAISKRHNNIL